MNKETAPTREDSAAPDPEISVFKALGGKRMVAAPVGFNLDEHPQFREYLDPRSNGVVFLTFTSVEMFREYQKCRDEWQARQLAASAQY